MRTYSSFSFSCFIFIYFYIYCSCSWFSNILPSTLANPLVIFYCEGTASWRAYLGGVGFFAFYLYIKNIPILPYLDVLGSSLGLGPFIGCWGCFLNGCCFGNTTHVPWSVRYPKYSQVYQLQVNNGLIDYNSSLSEAVYLVQLY